MNAEIVRLTEEFQKATKEAEIARKAKELAHRTYTGLKEKSDKLSNVEWSALQALRTAILNSDDAEVSA